MSKQLGLLEQYMEVRTSYPNAVILFQMGGFYQLYYYDATISEKVLGTKMMSRAVGNGKSAPMCGFPLSAMEKNVTLLTSNGYQVVVCNQSQSEDGSYVRTASFVKEMKDGVYTMPVAKEWDEYMRNFSEQEAIQQSVTRSKGKAVRKKDKLADKLFKELETLDTEYLSPMEAFNLIAHWKEEITKAKENTICE